MDKNMPDVSKMLSETCIAQLYQNRGWSCKIYPVFNIDKVKFSFFSVDKGLQPFDIYVDTDDFGGLCDSIKNRYLEDCIAKDQGQYPAAWTHTTGENGQKTLAIGKGQKGGIILQGRVKNGSNAFVSVENYQILLNMAFFYDMVSGRTAVNGYYKKLYDIFWEGMSNIEKYHSSYNPEEDRRTVQEAEDAKPEPEKAAAPVEKPKESASHSEKKQHPLQILRGRFRTKSELQSQGSYYWLMIEPAEQSGKGNVKEKYLVFTDRDVKAMEPGKFDKLKSETDRKNIVLSVKYAQESEKKFRFVDFV